MKNDSIVGVVVFKKTDNYKQFLQKIIENLDKPYFTVKNQNLEFNSDGLCICDIKKYQEPKWRIEFEGQPMHHNTKYLLLVLFKYQENMLFIRKFGEVVFLDHMLKEEKFIKFSSWNVRNLNTKNLRILIDEKIITNAVDELKQEDKSGILSERLDSKSFLQKTMDDYIALFNDLMNNRQINDGLPNAKVPKEQFHETKYNKSVCDNTRYKLLDLRLIKYIEFGDIYDSEKKRVYHNKQSKCGGDVAFQVILSALLSKSDMSKKLREEYKISENFTYVIGIIKTSKNIFKTFNQQLKIGIACSFIKEQQLDYGINIIKCKEE